MSGVPDDCTDLADLVGTQDQDERPDAYPEKQSGMLQVFCIALTTLILVFMMSVHHPECWSSTCRAGITSLVTAAFVAVSHCALR